MNYVVPVYQKTQIISTEAYIKKTQVFMYMSTLPRCTYMCITCVKYMQRPEEGIRFCGTAVADGSEPRMGAENCQSSKCSLLDLSYIIFLRCWGLNPGPHTCHPSALLLSYIPLAQKPTSARMRTHIQMYNRDTFRHLFRRVSYSSELGQRHFFLICSS